MAILLVHLLLDCEQKKIAMEGLSTLVTNKNVRNMKLYK